MSRSLDPKPSRDITDGPPLVPDVFPGDAAESSTIIGDVPAARKEAVSHGWRVLVTLSTLMGFASISTDLYLPAMPAMSTSLGAKAGQVELTVAGYLIGFSLKKSQIMGETCE